MTGKTQMLEAIATCPEELVPVVGDEITALGGQRVTPAFKAVYFAATPEVFYRCHLGLAAASSLYLRLGTWARDDVERMAARIAELPWDRYLRPGIRFHVTARTDRGDPLATKKGWVAQQIRHAIIRRLHPTGAPKKPREVDPSPEVVVMLSRKKVTVSLNTSGTALHKRGYRLDGHPAPIKETLAAALLDRAGYHGQLPLLDPFCGSGTIPIEACYRALGKAPLIHRKDSAFGLVQLPSFDRTLWRRIQDELRAGRRNEPEHPIAAADLDGEHVALAKRCALRARVERYISFAEGDFVASEKPGPKGLIVSNLPYGERLESGDDAKAFYRQLGRTLKFRYSGWQAYLLVPASAPWRFIGLKPSRTWEMMNGAIPTRLIQLDLYDGKQRARSQA